MKRRNSSRSPRRGRSLRPLLRLALPVVATALTLGSLLVNTLSGGTTASWALTGISVAVCAGAWWLYHLHHAASRPRRRRRRRATPPAAPSGRGGGAAGPRLRAPLTRPFGTRSP